MEKRWLNERGHSIDEGDPSGYRYRYHKAKAEAKKAGEPGVVKWLTDNLDPEAYVKSYNPEKALIIACGLGELGVVKWILAHGAADLTTKDSSMAAACFNGQLQAAKWIFQTGADSRMQIRNDPSLMLCAACQGHLDVVQWLHDVGADGNINSTVLGMVQEHPRVLLWMVLHGAANTESGHVDPAIYNQISLSSRMALRAPLSTLIDLHAIFFRLVLPAACLDASNLPEKHRPTLEALKGHSSTLVRLIADFAGAGWGRQLRIAREVATQQVARYLLI